MREFFVFALIVLLTGLSVPTLAGSVTPTVPDSPDPAAKYLFYLHGRGPQDFGVDRSREDYRAIVQAFSDRGFFVVSEVRAKNSQVADYAEKVAQEVKKLIASGVVPANITVVGYSRGGQLALISSGLVKNPSVRFVILAGCFSNKGKFKERYESFLSTYAPNLEGKLLSLYDRADPNFGTCTPYFQESIGQLEHKEIVLDTGKGHDLFQKPTDDWIAPVIEWINSVRIPDSKQRN
jgi:hypothetical protein